MRRNGQVRLSCLASANVPSSSPVAVAVSVLPSPKRSSNQAPTSSVSTSYPNRPSRSGIMQRNMQSSMV
ncbi:hypothetical protein I314_03255 [Cryptococcus bacillisporus CA1873]|uniref:Unplaced genomic scaffold supercont1.7, whole genome shotgun sequence n=2 Tax=Cryptococcus gattii TaxID=552467 RepID=A0A0D0VJS7_CRYGA|nr:hypothetical protein I312_02787 [Cryptococcus bacillisporus CA1280]KIR63848.1 hypothetical protein I314_03255 [Cryptococcus bacillisporus CA1873]|eukprot:KIR63848.1 hypothetical protein I314_03255 [Cryptococcus gattii CA1873]